MLTATQQIASISLWGLFAGYTLLSLVYVPYRAFEDHFTILAIAAVLFVGSGALSWATRGLRIPGEIGEQAALRWVALLISAGIVFRVIFTIVVPPVQLSDTLSYWEAAARLVDEGRYYYPIPDGELLAWRPPGYPLLLAVLMVLVGSSDWLPLGINLACFIVTCLAARSLANVFFASRMPGVFVVALLALWPGVIAGAGLAVTEWLSLALLTVGTWAFVKAQSGSWGWAAIAGFCAGYGALVRPSLLLFPAVWYAFTFIGAGKFPAALKVSVIATVTAAAVIAPWTIRNYTVLGAFVPISTNGGSVFYRANNPDATGGYSVRGARDVDLLQHDEVLWNRTGFSWAVEWIRDNPLDFVVLGLKKQAIFAGSDDTWVYWAIERAYDYTGPYYRIAAVVANSWWLLLILLLPVAVFRARRFLTTEPLGSLLLATTLYLPAVHSVFESQPRHHNPIISGLVLLTAMAFWSPSSQGVGAAAPTGEDKPAAGRLRRPRSVASRLRPMPRPAGPRPPP